ncbi:MAG: DUF2236 domain-containing protein [Candidatus Rokubacteria bacterium]|nr:DUF2236 domain-containing protein [Candidatus Rokubacteria bacterium]
MALLLGWPRAILLQFAHPGVAQGVADHSRFTAERFGRWVRLHRTLGAMLTLTFGSDAERADVVARINGIHDRVSGPAYTARDPELLLWVHATCVESFMLAYETFVAPLTPAARDRYCEESAEGATMLRIPERMLPRTKAALDAYMRDMLAHGPIAVGDTARRLARDVTSPPSGIVLEPAFWALRQATVGTLPPTIRAAYGYAWSPRRERALGVAARVTRAVLPRLPAWVRCWPRARRAFAREGLR